MHHPVEIQMIDASLLVAIFAKRGPSAAINACPRQGSARGQTKELARTEWDGRIPWSKPSSGGFQFRV